MLKKILSILLVITLFTGVCGCMNSEQISNEKIAVMQSYAENKYNTSFSFEYFQKAHDISYTNILTLSDGEVVFNVYQEDASNSFSDDYNCAILNNKFNEYIKRETSFSTSGIEIYSHIMLEGSDSYDYAYVTDKTMDEIVAENEFVKIILIAKVTEINSNKQQIFDLYQFICNLEPEILDFQVIEIKDNNEKLSKMLDNLSGYYTSDWEAYKEITSYIGIKDSSITSKDSLFDGVVVR